VTASKLPPITGHRRGDDHVQDRAKVCLGTDQLHIRRVLLLAAYLRPAVGDRIELALVRAEGKGRASALRRPVQPGDLQCAVAQDVAIHRLGAAMGVAEAACTRAYEAHRDGEPRLVQRRATADEHVAAIAQGCEPGHDRYPDGVRLHALVEDPYGLAGGEVAPLGRAIPLQGTDPEEPQLAPA